MVFVVLVVLTGCGSSMSETGSLFCCFPDPFARFVLDFCGAGDMTGSESSSITCNVWATVCSIGIFSFSFRDFDA